MTEEEQMQNEQTQTVLDRTNTQSFCSKLLLAKAPFATSTSRSSNKNSGAALTANGPSLAVFVRREAPPAAPRLDVQQASGTSVTS